MSLHEIWKNIPGYEEKYQVSNKGRVRSLDREIFDNQGGNYFRKGVILKYSYNKGGYARISLSKHSIRKTYLIHILVMLIFKGPKPEGQEIFHIDDDPGNPEFSNLRYGSKICNEAFKIDRKTIHSKLNIFQVKRIKEFLWAGISQSKLSNLFNVSYPTINRIKNNKTWAWV